MLLGPLRALSYALTHGVPSAILADCWARGVPWKASIPLVGGVKTVCQLATVGLASVTMGQNLMALSVANIGAMLDRAGVMLFKSSSAGAFATNQLLYGFFGVMLVLNCARRPALRRRIAWRLDLSCSCARLAAPVLNRHVSHTSRPHHGRVCAGPLHVMTASLLNQQSTGCRVCRHLVLEHHACALLHRHEGATIRRPRARGLDCQSAALSWHHR